MFHCLEFRELQKKSEFERAEWVRKQGNTLQLEFICIHLFHLNTSYNIFVTASFAGPHFIEYLGFAVTAECDVLLKCKVKKKKKETKQNHCQIFKDGSVANKLSPPHRLEMSGQTLRSSGLRTTSRSQRMMRRPRKSGRKTAN